MTTLSISEIEQAINYWRGQFPAGSDCAVCVEVSDLAEAYAMLIFNGESSMSEETMTAGQRDAYQTYLMTKAESDKAAK